MTNNSTIGLREKIGIHYASDGAVAKSCVENSFPLDARLCTLNRPPLFYHIASDAGMIAFYGINHCQINPRHQLTYEQITAHSNACDRSYSHLQKR